MAENGNNDPKTNGMSPKPNREPSESDPCMDEAKTKDEVDFFHRYRDQISEKTGLSRKGVYVAGGVALLTFLLLLIVIVLAACWPRIPHLFPVCEKAECLRAAAQIRESLNSSVSPCENVWEAACGSWLKNNPLPKGRSIWNQKRQVARKELEEVRDIIATLELPLHTNTVGWKLRHLYESCMNVDDVNSDSDRPLKAIISELERIPNARLAY
nr:unnamed protein product [Callosobruchus analis]